MPISLHARMTRSATSPRLAMRILPNTRGALRRAARSRTATVPYSTGVAVVDRDLADDAGLLGASISFMSFIASRMHSVWPSSTLVADLHERVGAGRRRAVERADHRRDDLLPRAPGVRPRAGCGAAVGAGAAPPARRRGGLGGGRDAAPPLRTTTFAPVLLDDDLGHVGHLDDLDRARGSG